MIEDIIKDATERMEKSLHSLEIAFNKIRTGRAHPSLLDGVMVSYYGSDTALNQLANITVEESRLLVITPWERPLISEIEKAIMRADLGLNPSNNGESIRLPMPALTEETRREYTKQAKNEAEGARVAVRNIRRDANAHIKELLKNKEVSEDDQRRAEDRIQKLTDKFIASVDAAFAVKEKELLSI
ncbi:MAG: ribosome recycling factor [Pseudohongiella sp.]|nr:ribosome recycling factor [Pseudohongiella sp.]MDO9519195.1 ribosome recycling factor [Pseudohongiella sp.]MDP2128756.1 ribosome recycling factor [Pseudohongiella sp.]